MLLPLSRVVSLPLPDATVGYDQRQQHSESCRWFVVTNHASDSQMIRLSHRHQKVLHAQTWQRPRAIKLDPHSAMVGLIKLEVWLL